MRLVSRLATVALIVAWFVLLRPVALGGPASYDIVTGTSMEPRLHTGDLVIAQARSTYDIGDVVVYRAPAGQPGAGSLIVHRIVGGDAATGYVVQGDNKDSPDLWRPLPGDIVGRSWIELPGSGMVLAVLRRPLVLATLLGALAAWWFLTSGSKPASRPGLDTRTSRPARRFLVGKSPDSNAT
jgi:signal peptidase